MNSSKWMARVLSAGFLFFFIKGLVWLFVAGAVIIGVGEATG